MSKLLSFITEIQDNQFKNHAAENQVLQILILKCYQLQQKVNKAQEDFRLVLETLNNQLNFVIQNKEKKIMKFAHTPKLILLALEKTENYLQNVFSPFDQLSQFVMERKTEKLNEQQQFLSVSHLTLEGPQLLGLKSGSHYYIKSDGTSEYAGDYIFNIKKGLWNNYIKSTQEFIYCYYKFKLEKQENYQTEAQNSLNERINDLSNSKRTLKSWPTFKCQDETSISNFNKDMNVQQYPNTYNKNEEVNESKRKEDLTQNKINESNDVSLEHKSLIFNQLASLYENLTQYCGELQNQQITVKLFDSIQSSGFTSAIEYKAKIDDWLFQYDRQNLQNFIMSPRNSFNENGVHKDQSTHKRHDFLEAAYPDYENFHIWFKQQQLQKSIVGENDTQIDMHEKYGQVNGPICQNLYCKQDDWPITYEGEYHNGLRIGKWIINNNQNILGGGYFNEKGMKIGEWTELDIQSNRNHRIHYNGEYKNGIKVNEWGTFYNNINMLKSILSCSGGGIYDSKGLKTGIWTDFKILKKYTYQIRENQQTNISENQNYEIEVQIIRRQYVCNLPLNAWNLIHQNQYRTVSDIDREPSSISFSKIGFVLVESEKQENNLTQHLKELQSNT